MAGNLLLDLKQKHTAALESANALSAQIGTSNWTAEQQTQFDGFMTEADNALAALKNHEKITGALGNIPTDRTPGAVTRETTVYDNAVDMPFGYSLIKNDAEKFYGARAKRPSENAPAWEKKAWKAGIETCFGDFMSEVQWADRTMKGGSARAIDVRLLDLQNRAQPAGASEKVPSDGGFLVAPDFATEVLQLIHETGVLDQLVKPIPLSDNTNMINIPAIDERSRQDGYRWGGIQAFWEDEAQQLVGSKPGFNMVTLVLKKLTGLFYATNEVLADARALGTLAMTGFAEEFGFKLDDGIINGTGAGQLAGILNSNALVSVAKSANQAPTTVNWTNIKQMWGRLWPRSRMNAVWLINQDVEQQLYGLVQEAGTGGIPVYQPAGTGIWGAAAAAPVINNTELNQVAGTLMGRPVVVMEQCQTLGTQGDIILFDPTQYLMASKGGVQAASSMHVRFLTDEMTYRWIIRKDGQCWWKSSLLPARGSNSFSPIIALATRS